VDHRKADVRQKAGFGDDTARFLRELRQLRDGAGLGHAELAARAHYPYDSIRAAEVGPALPDLPVLSAFVKGCGGTTEEWEERWRSLTSSPSLPVSTARLAGNSAAATAGARIGSAALDGEAPDPSLILAALDRVAEEMAAVNGEPAATQSLPEVSPADPSAGDLKAAPLAGGDPAGGGSAGGGSAGDSRSAAVAAPAAPAGSDVPAGVPTAGAGKPAGWDPIRVSTAWPVLPASPGDAGPVGNVRAARGSGRSNGAALPARAGGPAPATAWGAEPPAVHEPARGAMTASGLDPDGDGSPTAAPSRARVLAVCAVLLCVIAVVLAIFV